MKYIIINNSSGIERKSIWIINHYSSPLDNAAGSTRTFDIAKALEKSNYKVRVFSANNHVHLLRKIDISGIYREERINNNYSHHYIKTHYDSGKKIDKLFSMLSFKKNVIKAAKLIQESPDFVIGSSIHPFAWQAAIKIAKMKNAKFVAEVRDIWPLSFVNSGRMSPVNPFVIWLSFIERKAYKKAKLVIHLMRSNGYFEKKGAKKLLYLPNGVDLKLFDERRKKENKSLKAIIDKARQRHDFLIGYAGRLSNIYNPINIIESAELLSKKQSRIGFIVVGSGPKYKECLNEVNKRGLENLYFIGRIPKLSIPFFLNKMDGLLVHVTRLPIQEMFGVSYNKLYDYFAAGKPVIYSAPYGDKLKSDNNLNGVITAEINNPRSLAKAVKKLKNNYEYYKNASSSLRKFVEKEHNIEVLAKKLANKLSEVLRDN